MSFTVITSALRFKYRFAPITPCHKRRCRVCGQPVAKTVAKTHGVCGTFAAGQLLEKEAEK